MIVDKVTITLTNTTESEVKTKVEFEPPIPEGAEVEETPNLIALNYMLYALEGTSVNE